MNKRKSDELDGNPFENQDNPPEEYIEEKPKSKGRISVRPLRNKIIKGNVTINNYFLYDNEIGKDSNDIVSDIFRDLKDKMKDKDISSLNKEPPIKGDAKNMYI